MKLGFSEQIFDKHPNIKFHFIPSSGRRVVARVQTDTTEVIVASRIFAKRASWKSEKCGNRCGWRRTHWLCHSTSLTVTSWSQVGQITRTGVTASSSDSPSPQNRCTESTVRWVALSGNKMQFSPTLSLYILLRCEAARPTEVGALLHRWQSMDQNTSFPAESGTVGRNATRHCP
jgi:hypothetical protein